MKIESVAISIPSRRITNEDIYNIILEENKKESRIKLNKYIRLVKILFKKSGADTRYICDVDNKEKAFEHIIIAMHKALKSANMTSSDIDMLIYCGVGKGLIEPANAYFYAHEMGMKNTNCFDVVDACMSWIRALEMAYSFQKARKYRNIMVVNGEFNFHHHGYPDVFKIQNLRQIEYTFPSYTIGEAASATILSPSEQKWSFSFLSVPELCDLCTIPLKGYKSYLNGSKRIGLHGLNNFVSFGGMLFKNANEYLLTLAREVIPDFDKPKLYFPHAASSEAYNLASKNIVSPEKMYTRVFPRYGNLVSASIPAGLDLALKEGLLNRGDHVVFLPASAGMVFSVVQLNY